MLPGSKPGMIARVLQAAFERAAILEKNRRPAFLYIDEAADYFDDNINDLLNQARKYKLGVTLAHQFLDQLTPSLRSSVMTNPAIRFAGGISYKDANALDADMRTTNDFLMGTRKERTQSEFACYIRNVTPSAVKLAVPLGVVENAPKRTGAQFAAALERTRALVAEPRQIAVAPQAPLATPDLADAKVPQSDDEPAPAAPDPSAPSEW